jgi:cytoskeletal protein CcmA (bactofilin family)
MADRADDLGMPLRPARTPTQRTVPPRVTDLARPAPEPGQEPDSATTSWFDEAEPGAMVVGRGISLSGDIRSCNRLVVEGSVEAHLHDCREVEIAENGLFKGDASIEQAEVRGRFEGELVVRKRLLICATGRVSDTITYGEIEIERGGKVAGTIQAHYDDGAVPYVGFVRAGD